MLHIHNATRHFILLCVFCQVWASDLSLYEISAILLLLSLLLLLLLLFIVVIIVAIVTIITISMNYYYR